MDRIKTTTIGSYPVLSWMIGNSSRQVLRDAIMAVLKTQENAGLDLLTDGRADRENRPGEPSGQFPSAGPLR